MRTTLKLISRALYWATCKIDCLADGHRWQEVTKDWRFCTVCDKSEGTLLPQVEVLDKAAEVKEGTVTATCHEICPNHYGLANDLRCTLDRGHKEHHRHHLCEWPTLVSGVNWTPPMTLGGGPMIPARPPNAVGILTLNKLPSDLQSGDVLTPSGVVRPYIDLSTVPRWRSLRNRLSRWIRSL